MSKLQEALKSSAKKNNSSKNPSFYQRELRELIIRLSKSDKTEVRVELAKDPSTPSKTVLAEMIKVETDKAVIITLLKNPNMPKKSIIEFSATERAKLIDDDPETIEHLKSICTE